MKDYVCVGADYCLGYGFNVPTWIKCDDQIRKGVCPVHNDVYKLLDASLMCFTVNQE